MLKLNVQRTFPADVIVHYIDETGGKQKGKFNATFKVLPADQAQAEENAERRLLDLVLVGVDNIELHGEGNEPLTGDALLEACKNDPSISMALMATYNEEVAKKNLKRT